jgi:hypothetical protein
MKLHLNGQEMALAIQEYLKRKGHRPKTIGFFSEEAEETEGQPTFWCVAEVEHKEKKR